MKPMLFCRKVNRMTKTNQKIPVGWSVKKLGECFSFFAGGDVDKASFSKVRDELHPYPIFANALTERGLYGYSSKYKIKDECITITGRGDIGKVFYRKGFFTPIVRLITAIPRKNINAKFMSFSCECIKFWNETTGVPQLTIPQVQRYKILLPPLAEQEKIAEILSCWDEGIEKLSALIEKKKLQKKALMQKLLTAKIRLPGFTDPWNVKKLGEISLLFSGGTPSKEEPLYWTNGHIKWLSARYIEDNKVIGWDYITEEGLEKSSAKLTYANDIILVTRVSVGKIYFCKESYAVNQDLTVIRSKNVNSKFLFFLIKNKQALILEKSQGLAIKGITKEELSNMSFPIPPLAEQKAIADILSKADEEIELLNKKLEAFKLEKKALMQKLLTGQIRVKVN